MLISLYATISASMITPGVNILFVIWIGYLDKDSLTKAFALKHVINKESLYLNSA